MNCLPFHWIKKISLSPLPRAISFPHTPLPLYYASIPLTSRGLPVCPTEYTALMHLTTTTANRRPSITATKKEGILECKQEQLTHGVIMSTAKTFT